MVTLGIIGVVSALILPTLVKNHQRQVYVTQLHKVVTELSQAVEKATNDNNAVSLSETKYNPNNRNGAKDFLNDYFKVIQDCGNTPTPCFASDYKTISGDNFSLETPLDAVTLASGSAISIYANWLYSDIGYHGYFQLQVDTNGSQGPNIVGRDLFYMDLYDNGKVAERYEDADSITEYCFDNSFGYGTGCLSKIIQAGWKMDY